jgi:hypothetical protein
VLSQVCVQLSRHRTIVLVEEAGRDATSSTTVAREAHTEGVRVHVDWEVIFQDDVVRAERAVVTQLLRPNRDMD